jgi:hypothetical protein
MLGQGLRQVIAERRAAHIEIVAGLEQKVADAAGARQFLVQDDQDLRPVVAFHAATLIRRRGRPMRPICSP